MQTKMTINEQEKELIVQSTVDSAYKMMEKIITRQSPKKRVFSFCKPHEQSKTAITLTETQRLPARPRDFRISLEGQMDMLSSELSDILALSVRNYLLEPKRNNSHFSRGRLRLRCRSVRYGERSRCFIILYMATNKKNNI
jgi:hypothetical protein